MVMMVAIVVMVSNGDGVSCAGVDVTDSGDKGLEKWEGN